MDSAVISIKDAHPVAGKVMVASHLRSRNTIVQRRRLRISIHVVDRELGIDRRLSTILTTFWHIDGTHKLIKWKLVVHAAIDGYSRLITFCRCSPNNKSETVLKLFRDAVDRHGFP